MSYPLLTSSGCINQETVPTLPENDGCSLLAIDQYRREIMQFKPLSASEELELVNRARTGDQIAKTLLIESCLRYIYGVAFHYRAKFGRVVDVMDLIAAGNRAVVEGLECALSRGKNTCALLRVMVRHAIVDYGQENLSIIRVPSSSYRKGKRGPCTISLLARAYDDERTVLEMFEDADWQGIAAVEVEVAQ